MGWQDRDYNAGREEMRAYMANPGALLQYALPIFKSSRLYIHLSFWFLLTCIFIAVDEFRAGTPAYIPIDIAVMLVVCLWHELGHRVFARMVGGNHWEWVLWPLGGMVAPSCPRTPKATFVANIGGIVFTAVMLLAILGAAVAMAGGIDVTRFLFIPFFVTPFIPGAPLWLAHALLVASLQCCGIILMNLYPCYWFDGAHIWQSVLWPKLGLWKSVRVVCLVGMILAVPLVFLSLFMLSFFGMIFWALVFADCFRRRQALAAAGPDVMDEEEGPSYNYMDTPEATPRKKKKKKRWLAAARKRALKDQAEQARIDAILVKVKEKGLHSLTWWEKRTLKKATERQRQRDLAERY